jgi:hypothetical protein
VHDGPVPFVSGAVLWHAWAGRQWAVNEKLSMAMALSVLLVWVFAFALCVEVFLLLFLVGGLCRTVMHFPGQRAVLLAVAVNCRMHMHEVCWPCCQMPLLFLTPCG